MRIITVKLSSYYTGSLINAMVYLMENLDGCRVVKKESFSNMDFSGTMYEVECTEEAYKVFQILSSKDCLIFFDGPIPQADLVAIEQ